VKAGARRQRGIALLFVIAMITMGGTWYMISRLNRLSLNHSAIDRRNNAEVLGKAKQALIGYVIAQANKPGENNPGSLPCPELPTYFNDTSGNDGKTASSCATLPAVGRFPWRTIGTDKFVDSAGEPLWYVVSTGWGYTGTNTVINSNSVGQLNLDGVAYTTQAASDTVIALLIAPGPAIYTNCNGTGVSQVRSPTSGVAPDWKNYLECENATNPADANFVTTGPSASFNDQVLKITVGDIMPGIEAAIADRMQREIDPVLKTVYGWSSTLSGAAWGQTTVNNGSSITSSQTSFSVASTTGMPPSGTSFRALVDTELMLVTAISGNTITVTRGYEGSAATTHADTTALYFGGTSAIYPYAASFSNPSTAAMQGAAGVYAGLLPFNYAETSPGSGTLCTAGSAPRCSPTFVTWDTSSVSASQTGGGATTFSSNCTLSTSSLVSCTFNYSRLCITGSIQLCDGSAIVAITVNASNLGMALRQVLPSRISSTLTSPVVQASLGATGVPAGAAKVTITGTLAGSCTTFLFFGSYLCNVSNTKTVTVPITLLADHPLLDSANSNYGWFTRNKWHELTYYAIASGYSPAILPSQQPVCPAPVVLPNLPAATNCLTVTNVTPNAGQRAILILAGRSINGSTRPSSTISDYLEFGNATASYEKHTVSRANAPTLKKPFNDRIIVVDTN